MNNATIDGMYICHNCGETFNREDMVVWVEPHGEKVKGCPLCGADDYVEAERCRICGKYHDSEELFSGICEKCLDEKAVDCELMLDYLKDEKLLADFVFLTVFEMEIPVDWQISAELEKHLESLFLQQASLAKFDMSITADYVPRFYQSLVDYIHIDKQYSLDQFACWLAEHTEKAGAK